jgi:hypothetical protein
MAAEKVLMFSSDSTWFTRCRASMVLVSTVPPPSSRSEMALRWLFSTGMQSRPMRTFLQATALSNGLVGVPAVICT